MKTKLMITILLSFPFYLLSSQIPQGFNYQAIARNLSGEVIQNQPVKILMAIQTSLTGGTILWNEEHSLSTNQFGLVSFIVGSGPNISGTVSQFRIIDWNAQTLYLNTKVQYPVGGSYNDMGTSQIWSVPYSLMAKNVEGPLEKLDIKGADLTIDTAALFEVKNKNGNTVFAVYPEAVRVFVAEGSKGAKGGFAVGGFGDGKGLSQKYLVISKDSIRMYLDSNPLTKAKKGGFAVGGYDLSKGTVAVQNYLDVSEDSVRVYIDNNPLTKSRKGGFAVGGYDMAKGDIVSFFNVATDTLGIINPSQNRLLWYPQKNAFLTGKVLIEKPDSVGVNSFATGYESKAVGNWSQALGYKTAARGDYSTSIGNNSIANGLNSFAFGNDAQVTGNDSYAFGTGAMATGQQSFAMGSSRMNDSTGTIVHTVASATGAFALGFGSVASSGGAFAMGVLDTASGPCSLSMGYFNKSIGWFSTTFGVGNTVELAGFQGLATGIWTKAGNWAASAFGDHSYASGHTSFATGFTTVASGQLSSTFGDQTIAQSYGSMAIGRYNVAVGTPGTWYSWEPIFAIGIGTSPASRANALTVYKNGNMDLAGSLNKTSILQDRIEINSGGSGNRNSFVDFHSDDTWTDFGFRVIRNLGLNGSTDLIHRGTGNFDLITQDNAALTFSTYNAERMRIRSNGFVGINTSAPTFLLDVAGSTNLNKGLSGLGALFVNGDEAIWYDGNYFSWGYGGSYNYFSDKVTIGNAGSFGYMLYVQGSAYSTGTWAGSDARWKKDIEPLHNMLPELLKIQGSTYSWRTKEFPDMHFDQGSQIGLIAQDVEKIFPQLVRTDEKGYKSISYEKLSVLLLEGMKEQQQQIESTKLENQQLKTELDVLKEKMDRLEVMLTK